MKDKLVLLLAAVSFAFPITSSSVLAEDSNLEIPGSAFEFRDWFDPLFGPEVDHEHTRFEEMLETSKLSLNLRNYYFNRARPGTMDLVGWAQGGSIRHQMGRVGGIFSMTTELMGSYPLYAPDDQGGTLLLDKNDNAMTVFGVVNPHFTYAGQVLSVYRQRYSLPFVNEQDNRMLPITFEGYTIAQPLSSSKKFQYVAGYINGVKRRDSEDFVSMSDAAGVNAIESGMLLSGGRYYFTPGLSLSAIDYHVDDVLNIAYSEAVHQINITDEIENTLSGQFANQSSVGDDLLLGRDYSTHFFGVQNASSYKGFVFRVAGTFNDDSANIRSPYGTYPGYNCSIVEDFNRAGENAWQAGLAYDLARVGLNGLRVSTAYIQGNAAVDENTGLGVADRSETDVTIDYRVSEGTLNGLWVRLRSGTVKDDEAGTTQDFRIIINYDIALYDPAKPTL